MNKKTFIVFFSLLLFFSSFGIVFAEKKYYNDVYDFSVLFDGDWFIAPDEFYERIPPNEKETLIEAFIHADNNSKVLINVYGETNRNYDTFHDIIKYTNETALEERNYTRLVSPIKVEYGNRINTFEVDETNNTVYFESIGRDGNNESVGYYIQWIDSADGLIEIKAMLYGDTKDNFTTDNEKNLLFVSFEKPSDDNGKHIEVKTELKNEATQIDEASEDDETTENKWEKLLDLEYLFSFLLDKTIWIVLGVVSVLTVAIFIIRK